ncbi:MAG TPA: GNAT family N-acetyltransferase [Herpetosiphonaceae bacterium]|nr:GNAT family N-acetyltransferase [Herpetosiphonaceae bacterium]
MTVRIEPYAAEYHDAVIDLSLRAWAPVFASMEAMLHPLVFANFYPVSWRESQSQAVSAVCAAEDTHVWVALADATPAGFVAVKLHPADRIGEVYMIAVDPDFQRTGVASALMSFAVDWMTEAGMAVAMVETGGDPGHAPARRTYESLGFGQFPVARYYKPLAADA